MQTRDPRLLPPPPHPTPPPPTHTHKFCDACRYSWKCFPNQGLPGQHSPLYGYALDGFGVFGPRDAGGVNVTNAMLDECHGHSHAIPWDNATVDMYHYHLNNEYPYSIGCYRGTPATIDTTKSSQGQFTVESFVDTAAPGPAPAPAADSPGASPAPNSGASGVSTVAAAAAAAAAACALIFA